jgi:hypothetical protein
MQHDELDIDLELAFLMLSAGPLVQLDASLENVTNYWFWSEWTGAGKLAAARGQIAVDTTTGAQS